MRIGELAACSGLSNDTLRYYEKQGLIPAPQRGLNGYRDYPEETLQHLLLVNQAKAVGFTLAECEQLLSIFRSRGDYSCAEVKTFAEKKLAEFEQQIQRLQSMSSNLHAISDACCGGPESAVSCSILDNLTIASLLPSQQPKSEEPA